MKKNAVRTVTGKYLAYPTPARVQLKVGVRIISIFKEEEDSAVVKQNYYVGVIAEPPKSTNKYRWELPFHDYPFFKIHFNFFQTEDSQKVHCL